MSERTVESAIVMLPADRLIIGFACRIDAQRYDQAAERIKAFLDGDGRVLLLDEVSSIIVVRSEPKP